MAGLLVYFKSARLTLEIYQTLRLREYRQEIWCELHAPARRYIAYLGKQSTTSKQNSLRQTVSQMAGLLVYFKSAILTLEIYQTLRLRRYARNSVRIARSSR